MKVFLHWFVRLLLRPALSAGVPLRLQRAWSAAVAVFFPAPRGVHLERDDRAGLVTARITPAAASPGRGLLYLHGGGYTVGGIASHRKLAGWIAGATGARTWLPEYRLSPEHPHPAALKDALAVYTALVSGGQQASRLALAGDSAGGGLALATAIAIRDAGLPAPAAIVLFSPWVDLGLSGDSLATHAARDAMLKPSWLRWCADAHRGGRRADHPACSPLFADLAGLPPVLIHVGSEEVLLSDAQRLARRLIEAGGQVALREFDGCGHVFQFGCGLLAEADASVIEAGQFIQGRFDLGAAPTRAAAA